MDTEKQRIVYFDVLRIAATLAVVALHVSAQHWGDTEVSSRAWFAFNLFNSAVRWSVPVFVMISGALFLGRDIPVSVMLRKYVSRIAAAFVFWSALYALRDALVYHNPPRQALFDFTQGHYHLWFLYMIAGLYLLVPLLKLLADNERMTRYFLVLAFLFALLLPQMAELLALADADYAALVSGILGKINLSFPLGYSVYFIGGYYLSHRRIGIRAERVICLLGILGFLFTVLATQRLSLMQNAPYEKMYSNLSVNVFLTSAAVFTFGMRHLNFSALGDRGRRILRTLSKYTFGTYLVHVMVIEMLHDCLGVDTLSMNAFFSVPLLTLSVFVISMLLSTALNQLPFVKKYLV